MDPTDVASFIPHLHAAESAQWLLATMQGTVA